MQKIGKMKVLLSVLLVMLCVVGVASVNSFTKESAGADENVSVRSALSFTPRQIDVRVGQMLNCCAVATIPLGYDDLYFEENEYCEILVSGTDITIIGLKLTDGSDVA